jgi:hypothetical protein
VNTNEKGNQGLIRVIADLYNNGFRCFTPFDDYSPVDCIAMNTLGKCFRLQIKYRSLDKRGRYELPARSVVNGKSIEIDKTLIDGWAIYLSDIDKVVYFSMSEMGDKKCHYINPVDVMTMKTLDDW